MRKFFNRFFGESILDYNIRMLEEKKAKNGGLSPQDEDMLNNMKFGIGHTA